MKRVLSCVGAVAVGIVGCGTAAFAGAGGRGPSLTSTEATFVVGNNGGPGTTWTLNLWSKGTRVGTAAGTSGTLTVAVPDKASCTIQADVLRNGKWFAGNDGTFAPCGDPASSTTTTTTTTTPSKTSSKGGHKSKGGHGTLANSLLAGPTLKPVTAAAQSASTPVSSSQLAFTGVGPGFWVLTLVGGSSVLTGTILLLPRRRRHTDAA
jgi:hypothetical protein